MRPNRQIERKRKGRLCFLFGFLGCSYFRSDGWGLVYLGLLTDEIAGADFPAAGKLGAHENSDCKQMKCALPELEALKRDGFMSGVDVSYGQQFPSNSNGKTRTSVSHP